MKNGADSLKKVSLNSAEKAFEDANPDKAIPVSIQAAFMNSGQVCLAGSRILVQRSIFDEFVERFKEADLALKVGDPQDIGTNMEPVVSEQHNKKVTSYLKIAKEDRATLMCGGKRRKLP
jgi:aminomuconate-semialdehyde/2-hydroxymuconate-6-semialdehyde dehydrogenase